MSSVVVVNHITLDGVMQAPGRPDEDRRDGFEHGGWGAAGYDEVMARVMGERMAAGRGRGALLLGRRTYEDFFAFWPHQTDNPFTPVLDASTKYVASNTLREPLPWQNSKLLSGDAADAVAELRGRGDGNLTILGSGELIRSLAARDLVDEYLLMTHPLILGRGRRLFDDGFPPTRLRLTDSVTTTTGVVIGTYEPSTRSR